jgi:hypothetical protein
MKKESFYEQLLNFSKKKHAESVHRKCLSRKKYQLAGRIKSKYGLVDHQSDCVTAFGFAMLASKEIK